MICSLVFLPEFYFPSKYKYPTLNIVNFYSDGYVYISFRIATTLWTLIVIPYSFTMVFHSLICTYDHITSKYLDIKHIKITSLCSLFVGFVIPVYGIKTRNGFTKWNVENSKRNDPYFNDRRICQTCPTSASTEQNTRRIKA